MDKEYNTIIDDDGTIKCEYPNYINRYRIKTTISERYLLLQKLLREYTTKSGLLRVLHPVIFKIVEYQNKQFHAFVVFLIFNCIITVSINYIDIKQIINVEDIAPNYDEFAKKLLFLLKENIIE